jgi:uncharacterized membrane protein YgaE (UPF0421/DUF939 family)
MLLGIISSNSILCFVITLSSYDVFFFSTNSILTFVIGGVRIHLVFFILPSSKNRKQSDYLLRNMNTIIGSITDWFRSLPYSIS